MIASNRLWAVLGRFAGFVGLLASASGCLTFAQTREPFLAPGTSLSIAWRRQLTDPQLFGGHDDFMRDGKIVRMSTGIDQGYKPQEFAGAATDGEHVFVGSSHGVLYALGADDGKLLWRRPLSGPISSQPSYIAELGLLVVGDDDGALWALDPATGKERWIYRARGPIQSPPVYADGLIIFSSSEDRVYGIDAMRGTWKWQYDREVPDGFTIRGQSGPMVFHGRVYAGFADGSLACLETRTGDVVWVRPLGGEGKHYVDVDSTPSLVDGVLYVSSVSGGVYALDPKDGSVKWRFEVDGAGTVSVRDGHAYFAAGKLGVYCLDLNGHQVWHQVLPNAGELSTPLTLGSWVVVAAAESGAYVADALTGRLDQYISPGQGMSGPPSTDGRHVFLVSNSGFLWALTIGDAGRVTSRNSRRGVDGFLN